MEKSIQVNSSGQGTGEKDYLWENLIGLPYFRALLRAVEARFYQDIPLESPVLDLGCGDGHFASIAFDESLDVGVDPWLSPLREAARRELYGIALQADGSKMPFSDGYFHSIVSNSVLEHIPHIDAVIEECARVLAQGGLFVFCVPNHNFTRNLSIARGLDRIGLKGLAESYRTWFNQISRHHHCDPTEVWEERLSRYGFRIERHWHYFSPKALGVLEWGHYFGLPSLVSKKLFDRWILAPSRWNLGWLAESLRRYYDEPREQPLGSYSFYIVRKSG